MAGGCQCSAFARASFSVQDLCDDYVESHVAVATAFGVPLQQVTKWQLGQARPTNFRLPALNNHFGMRDDEVYLELRHAPSIAERIANEF